MSSDQLRHTLDLFAAARRLPAEERATFLDEACADDASLRREVEALLAHEHAAEFLTPPEGVEDLLGPITEMREFEESTPELPSDHPTQIGPFKIVAKLGEGGMGVVFEAIQESLGRRVALKILPGWFARDAKRVERFRREARATARIHHPNIVPVHEVGEAEGIHYYAMACIDGPSLDEVIGELRREAEKRRDGKSSATDSDYIANVVEQVAALAEGLHEAHALGLVHRDVKPSNVLVDKSGRYVLVDFGLVHEEDAQTITRSGETMGTLSYMSPEQLSGREVDARSDVYSLGVTLYEALTLRAPFEAKSAHDVKDGILFREPTPPRKLNGKVNRDLETIVLRALEKVPERRYSSASDFAADLRRFLRCEPIRARPQPAVRKLVRGIWRHKGKLAAALVLVVASVAAFLAWTYWPETRYTLRGLRSLTSHAGLTTEPSISADGGLIAYASTLAGIGNLDIWTQPPEASVEPTRLTFHEADDREPVFSPDSKSIAFRSERDGGGIYVAPVDGGEKTSLLLIAKHGRRPRYSPDGARIAYWRGHEGGDDVRSGEIYVVSSAGGAPRKLQAHFLSARYPVWLPDGEQLLFYGNGTADPETSPDDRTVDLWITPIDGGPAVATGASRLLRSHGLSIRNMNPSLWVPERNLVFVSARFQKSLNLWAIPISPATGKVGGSLHRITTGTLMQLHPWVSGDRIVFASTQLNVDVWSLPLTGGDSRSSAEPERLTRNPASDWGGSASADGKKVVFTSDRSGDYRIWMKDLDAGGKETLLRTDQVAQKPFLSPDGSKVAYRSDGSLFVMELATGASRRCAEASGVSGGWSSNGELVSFMAPGSRAAVGIFNTETAETFVALRHPEYNIYQGHFSPDDRWIAFNAVPRSGGSRLFIAPFNADEKKAIDEGEWIPVTAGSGFDDKPNWSRDGNLLYFLSERDGSRCIWAQRLEPETRHPLGDAFEIKHFGDTSSSPMNVSIGRIELFVTSDRILFNSGEMTGNIWMAELQEE